MLCECPSRHIEYIRLCGSVLSQSLSRNIQGVRVLGCDNRHFDVDIRQQS